MDCLFCKIIQGDIPAERVLETDHVLAFRDINPQAPEHILIIPKQHIPTINELDANEAQLAGQLVLAAKQIAKDSGVHNDGYRLVFNCNANAGQEVFHIHLHLLAGRKFTWPPG